MEKRINYFRYINNFEKCKDVKSISILESNMVWKPKVSIVIPTFKRSDTLKYAIESALNQNHFIEYEVIVLDNNPERDDSTERLLSTYSDERLSYYKNEINIGMAGNWNRGVELAKSEWVSFLHDDDFFYPDFLCSMYEIVCNNPCIEGLSPRPNHWVDSGLAEISKVLGDNRSYKGNIVKLKHTDLLFYFPLSCIGLFLKRKHLFEIGGFNQDYFPILDYVLYSQYQFEYNLYYYNKDVVRYRVGMNESLRPSTIELHLYHMFYFGLFLCGKNSFKFISEMIIHARLYLGLIYYKKENPDYTFDKVLYLLSYKKSFVLTFLCKALLKIPPLPLKLRLMFNLFRCNNL